MAESLIAALASQNVARFSLDLQRNVDARQSQALQTVIIGHSGAGKSAILERLGYDRNRCDMDRFISRNRLGISVESCLEMLKHATDLPLFVASNQIDFLTKMLACREAGQLRNVHFLYLRRPMTAIHDQLSKSNTDGIQHKAPTEGNFARFYQKFDEKFLQLADSEIEYTGSSLDELSAIFAILFHSPMAPSPSQRKEMTDAPADETGIFSEYKAILDKGPPFHILDQGEMRSITAGGYQVFDATKFPPIPDPKSISGKKLNDLQWRNDEFHDRSVIEIGCQLGFFTFTALARGAKYVVGFDLNSRFVGAANHIAANYKTNICKWSSDQARFATRRFNPGDTLPFIPDVLVANSIVHWWVIQNPNRSLSDIMQWLKSNCGYAVYFEGCVTAEEEIMKKNNVPTSRYNEDLFLSVCRSVFSKVELVGRCSYDPRRIVVRLFR